MIGPPEYLSKEQASAKLGVCVKTLDRRMRTEPYLAENCIRAGKRLWLHKESVERFFLFAKKRGRV